jgi:hypothetical protein
MNLAFSYVEEPLAREACAHKGISIKTLMKYMQLLRDEVIKRIKMQLIKAKTFGLAHDAWTHNSDHYLGLFALFTEEIHGQLINCGSEIYRA